MQKLYSPVFFGLSLFVPDNLIAWFDETILPLSVQLKLVFLVCVLLLCPSITVHLVLLYVTIDVTHYQAIVIFG